MSTWVNINHPGFFLSSFENELEMNICIVLVLMKLMLLMSQLMLANTVQAC